MHNFHVSSRTALLLITAFATFLLFYRLGDLALDPDEALIIQWTLKFLSNETTLFDLIKRFAYDGGFIHLGTYSGIGDLYPAPNMYLMMISFRIFGVSPWTARLPSALIALGTIPLFYGVARRTLQNSHAALVGTLLFATSAPILFLMRQNRYTSTTICLALWLLWAYLGILEHRKYSIPQYVGAMLLFFYTSYYIFFPVAAGFGCHALLGARGRARYIVPGISLLILLGLSFIMPEADSGTWIIHRGMQLFQAIAPISILNNFQLVANEFNLIGFPFVLVVIYLWVGGGSSASLRLRWTVTLLWGGFAFTSSPVSAPVFQAMGMGLDRLWPSLSPRLFNRLVDPRSWMMLCMLMAILLMLRALRPPSAHAIQRLGLPLIVIIGAVVAFCGLYSRIWTRYLACLIVLSFMVTGFLLAGIMARRPVLGGILLVLILSSNLLSTAPFLPGHYPYWQWKFPHWTYRILTGDPIAEIILNFWSLPPL